MDLRRDQHSTNAHRAGRGTGALIALLLLGCAGVGIAMAVRPPAIAADPTVPRAPAPASPVDPAGKSPAATAPDAPEGVIRTGQPKANARVPGTIRLATYNVENFFDEKDEMRTGADGRTLTPVKPLPDRAAAAAALREINADIVALQEVGSLESLLRFRDEHLKGMGYEHVVSIDSGDERGIENAVLSRFPLKNEKIWKMEPLGEKHPETIGRGEPHPDAGKEIVLKRSPLRVTVAVPAEKVADILGGTPKADAKPYLLTLLVVHYKSGRDYSYWRAAEARRTLLMAKEVESTVDGQNVVVLGDFNARDGEEPHRVLTEAGFLDAFDGTPAGDTRYLTHASGRRIDHILLNTSARHEFTPDSRFVLGTPQRPARANWQTTPAPKGYASDHSPVVIDLKPVD